MASLSIHWDAREPKADQPHIHATSGISAPAFTQIWSQQPGDRRVFRESLVRQVWSSVTNCDQVSQKIYSSPKPQAGFEATGCVSFNACICSLLLLAKVAHSTLKLRHSSPYKADATVSTVWLLILEGQGGFGRKLQCTVTHGLWKTQGREPCWELEDISAAVPTRKHCINAAQDCRQNAWWRTCPTRALDMHTPVLTISTAQPQELH